jgi:hypothetical protein
MDVGNKGTGGYATQETKEKQKSGVRFDVFTAVTMKNVVFWDIKPSSYFTGDTLRLSYRVQTVNVV